MSYVIHVWEFPRPTSFDEAKRIAFDLAADVVGQNPAYVILAGQLTARFPCITRTPDGVWSDGPLDGKTEERVYVLGIGDRLAEVFAHIVECAAKLGLTVFDMQSAIAYLPSGQMLAPLPVPMPAAPPPTLPEPSPAPFFVGTAAMADLVLVWEEPRLLNYHEADDIVFNRAGDVLGQNLRFMVLAEWLNARFPCNPLEPQVWRAGAVDGRTEKRALVLDICARHEEVVAYIFDCASSLGLSAFDMQSETALNASGWQLRPFVPPAVPAKPSVPMHEPLPDIREAIYAGMMRVLGDVGFVYDRTDEGQLILRFPGGHHRIGVPLINWYPLCYRFEFFVITRLDAVAAIAAPFKGIRPDHVEMDSCSQFGYGYLYGEANKKYEVASREGLALAITEMNTVIVNKLLPLLDRISHVHGMDAVFNASPTNPPFQSHWDKGFDALTLARLANNPEYPALCARYLEAMYPGDRQLQRDLPRLIAYLDHYDADNPAPPPPFPFDDVTRFIADYDGSQVDEIAVKWVSTAGQKYFDVHAPFRAKLMQNAARPMRDLPLILLRDLFRAEAMVCTSTYRLQFARVADLFYSLLSRGGVAELAPCAQCIPLPWLGEDKMTELPFAADIAESLRHACEKRTRNPRYGDMAERYASLERYFAAPKTLRREDFYDLQRSLKLPRSDVYDDYAGTNSILWDGKHLSLRLISQRGYWPSVQITVIKKPYKFFIFHCEAREFDEFSIQEFLRYVMEHEAAIRDAAVGAGPSNEDLRISVLQYRSAWIFKQRIRAADRDGHKDDAGK